MPPVHGGGATGTVGIAAVRPAAMRLRDALACLAVGMLAGGAAEAAAAAEARLTRPNIVVIVTDDQRADTLWSMRRVRRLLVDRGIRFTNAFASNPHCCPSRASLLTGNYSHTTRVYTNVREHGSVSVFHNLGAERSTIAVWLDRAGYRTGLFGKYINLYAGGYVPPGWDRFHAGAGYYGPTYYVDGVARTYPREAYGTTILGEEVRRFIDQTPLDQPFFAYYAPHAPHRRAQAEARYEDLRFPGAASRFNLRPFDEADISDKPAWVRAYPRLTERVRREIAAFRIQQLQALRSVDDEVGRIVARVAERGQLDETVFVFMSDNGVNWGDHRLRPARKGVPYNGASGLPLVIRYDGLRLAPRVERRLVANVDVAPTLAAMAGVRAPRTEGRSLVELMRDRVGPWRRRVLLETYHRPGSRDLAPTYCGIRTRRYLYVRYDTGERELYDSRRDPGQLRNVHGEPRYRGVQRARHAELRSRCRPAPPGYTLP